MQRRDLFRLATAAATATSLPRWGWSATLRQRPLFPLGVASGAPTEDGVVLWTRLLDGPVPGTVPADTPRTALPEAKPALYFGLSLGLTFPLNIVLGIPVYLAVAQMVLT